MTTISQEWQALAAATQSIGKTGYGLTNELATQLAQSPARANLFELLAAALIVAGKTNKEHFNRLAIWVTNLTEEQILRATRGNNRLKLATNNHCFYNHTMSNKTTTISGYGRLLNSDIYYCVETNLQTEQGNAHIVDWYELARSTTINGAIDAMLTIMIEQKHLAAINLRVVKITETKEMIIL